MLNLFKEQEVLTNAMIKNKTNVKGVQWVQLHPNFGNWPLHPLDLGAGFFMTPNHKFLTQARADKKEFFYTFKSGKLIFISGHTYLTILMVKY